MTTPTLHTPGQITDAVLAALRGAFGATKVHDHVVPGDAAIPYLCLYVIEGGGTSGPPLTAPDANVSMTFQVDCVGRKRQEAQYLQGKLFQAVLGRTEDGAFATPINIPTARRVAARMLDSAPGGVEVQGTPPQYEYVTQDRFTLTITPSS